MACMPVGRGQAKVGRSMLTGGGAAEAGCQQQPNSPAAVARRAASRPPPTHPRAGHRCEAADRCAGSRGQAARSGREPEAARGAF